MAATSEFPLETDVLVVGAGPIGLTFANLLGEMGIRTGVIERDAGLGDMPRAVTLDDEGMRTLQAARLLPRITPHMLLGYDHHLLGRRGQLLLRVNPTSQEYGFCKRNRFHQPELERHLLEAALERDTVQVAFQHRLVEMDIQADHVLAKVERPAGIATIRARFVVACDGGGSTVRRLGDIGMQGESHPEPWIVIDTDNNPDDARFSRAVGDPARPNVNVPGPAGRRRYEFMLLPGEDESAASTEAVHRLLAPLCDLTKVQVVRHTVYTFHSLIADRFAIGRRVFLAGDAAHMMPPFQGQGMNSGLRDAANLAWKLAAVIGGQAGEALLDSYEIERKPHVGEMILLSRRVGQILMTRNPILAWLRDTLFAASRYAPAIRGYLTSGGFKPAPRAASGHFLADGGLAGRMFVQPDVLDCHGVRRPLDELLGVGFALVRIGPDEAEPFGAFDHPFWARLKARKLFLLPGGLPGGSTGADAVASDIGSQAARWVGDRGPVTLLLRPDRYVAAVIRPGQEDRAAEQLDALAPL